MGEKVKFVKHGLAYYYFFLLRKCSILFPALMFMPVVPAILTRNVRHFRFQTSILVAYLQFVMHYSAI